MTAKHFHFIGIGGAGMAPLAHLLLASGARVSGSDTALNAKTAELTAEGAVIYAGHAASHLDKTVDKVVFSSAVTTDNPEYAEAARRDLPLLRRGAMLAEFAGRYRRVAAISGSHGKSSITALLAHILSASGCRPGFMIGAAVNGAATSAAPGSGFDIFVTEADESDGTHKLLSPFLGIVPNFDEDHAWSVGGAGALSKNFQTFAARSRHLLYYASSATDRLFAEHPAARRLERPAPGFELAGFHGFQAENANLAVQAAVFLGLNFEEALRHAASFPGIARRLTLRFDSPRLTVVEDYAHHPTEVAASIAWLRERYPHHHLRVLFQPHRYARLAAFFDEFVTALRQADSAVIAPVFAAWCETGELDSADLARAVGGGAVASERGWDKAGKTALAGLPANQPTLLAVLGAGDIEQVFSYLPHH